MTGPIPAELGNLTNLSVLFLGGNQLTGPIPAELGDLTNLEELGLEENQLTGPIPAELGDLTNLVYLGLIGKRVDGADPGRAGPTSPTCRQLNLTNLGLYNVVDGADPGRAGQPHQPEYLNLGATSCWPTSPTWQLNNNQLTGPIPDELGNLTNLRVLDLGNNQLTGPIPVELGNLEHLDLSGNELTGPNTADDGGSVASDRAALVAFYNATGGPGWSASTNWLSGTPR